MKKIMVMALGHLSNGEITIAAETLRNTHQKNCELLFVSHPSGMNYIRSTGLPARGLPHNNPAHNRQLFDDIVKEWQPDAIVCADVYTQEYAVTWCGFDFAYLRNLSLPIGSMDQYEWEATDFSWDFLGTQPLKVRESLIRECDFLIRPCPLNKPREYDGRIVTAPLFSQPVRSPKLTREEWLEKLGIPGDKPVVFTVNSNWEYVEVTKSLRLKKWIRWMPRIIHQYLAATKIPMTVVHVGPKSWEFDVNSRIDYRSFKKMEAPVFRDTIFHADLFYGTNSISITLSNAVYSLTPSVLFQNPKKMDFAQLATVMEKMPGWYREMAQDVEKTGCFGLFPWGWYRFLEPVFSGNDYSETFATAPVLMPPKAVKTLKTYLTDQTAIDAMKEKQHAYFKTIDALPPIDDFLGTLGS